MRFSLKTFLLTTTLFGAGCGMFVHFKNNNPQGLLSFLRLFSTVLPALLGLITIFVVGIKGSPPRNRKLLAWGGVLVGVPLAIIVLITIFASRGAYSMVATDYLVSPQSATAIDDPRIWHELTVRATAGELSPAQIEAAVDSHIIAMEQAIAGAATGWKPGEPLHQTQNFFNAANVGTSIPAAKVIKLLDLYHGSPTITYGGISSDGKSTIRVRLELGCGNPFSGTFSRDCAWSVAIFVNGNPAQVQQLSGGGWRASALATNLETGEHEIRVDFIRAYIPSTAGNGGFTTAPVKSWNVSKDFPLKTIPVTLKVTVP